MFIAMSKIMFKFITLIFERIERFMVSKPAELPRQLLAEPYVTVSRHTAPIKQTHPSFQIASVQKV